MRVKSVFGVLVTLLCLPAAALAQERKLFGEVGIGPTSVFGLAGNDIGTGFNFDLGAIYKISQVLGVKVDTLVTKSDVKDSVTSALGVGDGDAWLWHLSGDIVVSTPVHHAVSLYGVGGLGVYYRKVELTNPGVGLVTVCDPWLGICFDQPVPATQIVGSRSSTDFGMNIGAGLNFLVGHARKTALFVEVRYHYVFGPTIAAEPGRDATTANTEIMPITFGIRF